MDPDSLSGTSTRPAGWPRKKQHDLKRIEHYSLGLEYPLSHSIMGVN